MKTIIAQRKVAVMQLADNMAAAASSLNGQNYDTLMLSRTELKSLCDDWEQEDVHKDEVLANIKQCLLQ